MLSKNKRLNLKKDFLWVKAESKKAETSHLRLYLRFGDNLEPRVGVALTGKFFKNATQRNRAKRLVFLAVGKVYEQLPKATNLIIMPKGSVVTSSKEELIVELKNVKNINLFN